MSTIKDRNSTDLTEAEDNRKRWQEYTEELQKKDLNGLDNHNHMVILDHSLRARHPGVWALGSITMNKASEGNGIPAELFQVLKDDAVKVLHSICQQIWKLSSGHRIGKGQLSFQCQRKITPKNVQITTQLHSFYMLARSCSKSFKLGFKSA